MDFGLARWEQSSEKLTRDGSVLGTPAYMSPEQTGMRGMEVGPASDQYSLGVVLYEMVCGEKPFSGDPMAVMFQIRTDEPPRPRERNPQVPAELERICLKAMAKRPEKRYSTAGEMAEALHGYLGIAVGASPRRVGGEGMLAKLQQTIRQTVERHRQQLIFGSAGLTTVILLISIVFMLRTPEQPTPSPGATPESTSVPVATDMPSTPKDIQPPPLAVAPFDEAQAKQHQQAWAKYLGVPVEITNSIGMKLRLIPHSRGSACPRISNWPRTRRLAPPLACTSNCVSVRFSLRPFEHPGGGFRNVTDPPTCKCRWVEAVHAVRDAMKPTC